LSPTALLIGMKSTPKPSAERTKRKPHEKEI
jgi:hypothetical protein